MSRIGNTPVTLPSGVKVSATGGRLAVTGPKGAVETFFPPELALSIDDGGAAARIARSDNGKKAKALHGTFRRLLENMVVGVHTPYVRELEIVGVGYQAKLQQNSKLKRKEVRLQVGFANPVDVPVPKGLEVEVPTATYIKITGCDKALAGQFAANVRAVRPPEPYNGKGIRYKGERIQKKQGKSFVNSD